MTTPVVSRISVYPFKSLDGLSVEEASAGAGSFITGDRQYALFDERGKYINGKANPLVHRLRLKKIPSGFLISSDLLKTGVEFSGRDDIAELEEFLGRHFNQPVVVRENNEGRFLDIPVDSGITIVSTASLEKVRDWMGLKDLDEARRRFRATVEIDGVPPFWEDILFGVPGDEQSFRLGDLELICVGPRERCVVPTRDSMTGEVTPAFPKKFAAHRWEQVPGHSQLHDWGHGYFLSVDCRIAASSFGKIVRLGDQLTL